MIGVKKKIMLTYCYNNVNNVNNVNNNDVNINFQQIKKCIGNL